MTDGNGSLTWNTAPNSPYLADTGTYSTQNTSTTTLKTVVMPANSLGTNGTLRITAYSSNSGVQDRVCTRISFGNGSSTSTVGAVCAGLFGSITATIRNINSASVQAYSGWGTSGDGIAASLVLPKVGAGTVGPAYSVLPFLRCQRGQRVGHGEHQRHHHRTPTITMASVQTKNPDGSYTLSAVPDTAGPGIPTPTTLPTPPSTAPTGC